MELSILCDQNITMIISDKASKNSMVIYSSEDHQLSTPFLWTMLEKNNDNKKKKNINNYELYCNEDYNKMNDPNYRPSFQQQI